MLFSLRSLALAALCLACITEQTSASVFLPQTSGTVSPRSFAVQPRQSSQLSQRYGIRQRRTSPATAMAIPGYGVAEQVFVGGFMNFLSIYNLIITGRILLSWFPQAQGVAALQPVYAITDPYLNLFRGVIPPIFGLDLSPILAFFLLNFASSATAALGAEVPEKLQTKLLNQQRSSGWRRNLFGKKNSNQLVSTLDY